MQFLRSHTSWVYTPKFRIAYVKRSSTFSGTTNLEPIISPVPPFSTQSCANLCAPTLLQTSLSLECPIFPFVSGRTRFLQVPLWRSVSALHITILLRGNVQACSTPHGSCTTSRRTTGLLVALASPVVGSLLGLGLVGVSRATSQFTSSECLSACSFESSGGHSLKTHRTGSVSETVSLSSPLVCPRTSSWTSSASMCPCVTCRRPCNELGCSVGRPSEYLDQLLRVHYDSLYYWCCSSAALFHRTLLTYA